MSRAATGHPEPARVLRACRRFVEIERDLILEGHCVLGDDLRPRPETLCEVAKPALRSAETLIRRIDAALARLAR